MTYEEELKGKKVTIENSGGFHPDHTFAAKKMNLKRWEKDEYPDLGATYKVLDYITEEGSIVFAIENIDTKQQYLINSKTDVSRSSFLGRDIVVSPPSYVKCLVAIHDQES